MSNLTLQIINPLDYTEICVELLQQINPSKKKEYLNNTLIEMCNQPNYTGFGLFQNEELIGFSSGWTSVRIYCGKQLELDNVIVHNKIQSKGYGKWFMEKIERWAKNHNYETIELNSYVSNSRSHKFYFNQGHKIIGYHFQKKI